MEPKMTWRNITNSGVEITKLHEVCKKNHIATRGKMSNGNAEVQILVSDDQYNAILKELA